MNKQAFETGFIKAAMAEGLNYYEAAELYKTADGNWPAGEDLVHSLMAKKLQSGGLDDVVGQAFMGGGLGALGGGALGALSADEEKGQSKWKRGFGGALAGGGLGALAGGGMQINDQFNQAKQAVPQLLAAPGRAMLSLLQTPGMPPQSQSMLLDNMKKMRQTGEEAGNASLWKSMLHQVTR